MPIVNVKKSKYEGTDLYIFKGGKLSVHLGEQGKRLQLIIFVDLFVNLNVKGKHVQMDIKFLKNICAFHTCSCRTENAVESLLATCNVSNVPGRSKKPRRNSVR